MKLNMLTAHLKKNNFFAHMFINAYKKYQVHPKKKLANGYGFVFPSSVQNDCAKRWSHFWQDIFYR